MITYILIPFIVYLLSLIACWNWTRIAYNEGGRYEHQKLTLVDIVLIFLPIVNSALAIVAWHHEQPRIERRSSDRLNKWCNRFFNVKKGDK